MPYGSLGALALRSLLARDLEGVFDYRRDAVELLLGGGMTSDILGPRNHLNRGRGSYPRVWFFRFPRKTSGPAYCLGGDYLNGAANG